MLLLSHALLILCLPSLAEPRVVADQLEPIRAAHQAPALVAAAIQNGELTTAGATGVRQLGGSDVATTDDVVLIGSCGKSATRLLIGRLVDAGRLRLDATLAELLADVPMRDEYRPVTVAQLMSHRGGIQPYTEIGPQTPEVFRPGESPTAQRAAFAAEVLGAAPAGPVGEREIYSNAGYSLLGHVAERVARQPFEELIAAEVFTPCGMKSAFVGRPHERESRPFLIGHVRTADGYRLPENPARPTLAVFAPAGMMSCTILDFARFAGRLAAVEAGRAGDYLKPETAAALRELRPGGDGEGVPFFGGDGLYTAAFALWPARGLAIVAATNAGDNDAVCAAAIEALRAELAPDAKPVEGTVPPAGRPRYGFKLDAQSADDVRVVEVTPGMPAAVGGLRAGDRIVALNGTPLSRLPAEQFRAMLGEPTLKLRIERDGGELEIELKAAAAEPE